MGTTNFDSVEVSGSVKIGASELTESTGQLVATGGITATPTEINKLAGVTGGTAAASKAAVLGTNKNLDQFHTAALYLGAGAGTQVTATAAEINRLAAIGGTPIRSAEVTFTETGAGTYTGSVTVPAGATLMDIIVNGVALWDAATSAALKVGDAGDDDGFYTGVDLKATDLLAGESLSFALAGGKAGAYIANSQVSPRYSATERVVSGIVASVGAGTAGRTRMTVIWSLPVAGDITAATKA